MYKILDSCSYNLFGGNYVSDFFNLGSRYSCMSKKGRI